MGPGCGVGVGFGLAGMVVGGGGSCREIMMCMLFEGQQGRKESVCIRVGRGNKEVK